MLGLLAQAGISIFNNLVSKHGEDLISESIKKVTGIELKGRTEPLTPQEKQLILDSQYKIKELDFKTLELHQKDRDSARNREVNIQTSKDWLVRNTGSMIAVITVILTFMLDGYVLYQGINSGMDALNPIVTLISGAMTTRVMTIYSFYFGSSKTEADKNR